MTWVLGRGGQILYKAMWTSAARVGEFLERAAQAPRDHRHAPFHTEQVEIRTRDQEAPRRQLRCFGRYPRPAWITHRANVEP